MVGEGPRSREARQGLPDARRTAPCESTAARDKLPVVRARYLQGENSSPQAARLRDATLRGHVNAVSASARIHTARWIAGLHRAFNGSRRPQENRRITAPLPGAETCATPFRLRTETLAGELEAA